MPASGPAENALYRARVSFFVDAFFSKVVPHFFTSIRSASDTERDAAAEQLVAAVAKEVEPLLASADGKGPFFGGSDKLTLAEVSISNISMATRQTPYLTIAGSIWVFLAPPLGL